MAKVLKHSIFLLLVCLLVLVKASRHHDHDHKHDREHDEEKTKALLKFSQKQDDDESKIKLSLNYQHESDEHKFGRRGSSGSMGSGGMGGGHVGVGGEGGCNCGDTKLKEFMRKFMIVLRAYVSKEFIPDLQEMVAKMGHFVLEFMAKEKPEQMGKINKFLEHSAKVTSEAVAKHS